MENGSVAGLGQGAQQGAPTSCVRQADERRGGGPPTVVKLQRPALGSIEREAGGGRKKVRGAGH